MLKNVACRVGHVQVIDTVNNFSGTLRRIPRSTTKKGAKKNIIWPRNYETRDQNADTFSCYLIHLISLWRPCHWYLCDILDTDH